MIKEQAEMLQEDFVELSKEHGIKASYGYFVDNVGKAMLAYNNINDNDMMYMLANVVIRIAKKNNTTPDVVLGALSDGINKNYHNPAPNN